MTEQNTQVQIINSIKDTELSVSAVLMEKEFSIGQLTALNPSSVLFFDAPTTDPAELRVNGKKVATGTVVQAKDNFAVKIDELA